MKILYACTIYPPAVGGAQIHLHSLAREVDRMGHAVHTVTHTSRNRRDWLRLSTIAGEQRARYVHDGIPVTQLGFSRSERLRMLPWALSYYGLMQPSVRRLARIIGKHLESIAENPDVVHCSRIGREFLASASLDFARSRNIPFVFTPNHHARWEGPLYREYDKIYRAADAVLALTEVEKDLFVKQKNVRPERVHVTGIGPVLSETFSAEDFRNRHGLHHRFVLFVGQQLKYKGLAAVVEAAGKVWSKHPDVRFVFVGPRTSYSERLFATCQDDRFINLGQVDLETKTSALAACELLCVPSVQESFGGVFVEAWSHRKAVIGGRIPPVASVVDDGRDGFLANQSSDEIAALLCRLLSDPDECRAMGNAGWHKVQTRFTWPRLAQQTLSVYESLGAGGAMPCTPIPQSLTNVMASHSDVEILGGHDGR